MKKRADRDRNPSTRRGYARSVFVLVTTTGLLVALCGYYINQLLVEDVTFIQQPTANHLTHFNVRNVNRTRISSSHTSYRQFADKRWPMILVNSLASQWKASKHFNTHFLSEHLPTVSVYTQSDRTFITYHDNKPLEDFVVGEEWSDYNIKTDITVSELLGWGNTKDNNVWRYYSQEVTQLRSVFPDIIDYIQPLKPLVLDKDSLQVNLWIGRCGIITHTHYDATYNFFIQLQGRKRFTLFPPTEKIYLYPCLHPHYGHSQVDILGHNLSQYPSIINAQAFIADLGPGDMLIVPPYWLHHVETMEESVSVNVWSDAPEYSIMNDIYTLSIPFEDDWQSMELAIASCVYSKLIIESVDMETAGYQSFIEEILINQRYSVLISTGKLQTNDSCWESLDDYFSKINWQDKVKQYSSVLGNGVNTLRDRFMQIEERSIRAVCVGNYIEHLYYRVVGLECLYGLLLTCSNTK